MNIFSSIITLFLASAAAGEYPPVRSFAYSQLLLHALLNLTASDFVSQSIVSTANSAHDVMAQPHKVASISILVNTAALILGIANLPIPFIHAINLPAEAPLSESLLNPGRGFYYHTESHVSSPSPLDLASLQSVRQAGRTIILRVYYLDTFLETDTLSTAFLDQLVADFQTMLVSTLLVLGFLVFVSFCIDSHH